MALIVHIYGPAWDCIDLSPFSIKLQTWLRLAGLGERPSTLDGTVFGFLHALLVPPLQSPVKAFVAGQPRLVAYHQRVLALAWPERA
jgi:hypothetical protein